MGAAVNRLRPLLDERRVAWAVVLAAVVAAFVFVFFLLPPLLVPSDVGATEAERVKLRNDVRSAGTQFLGGLALVAGLLFTARTLRLNREGQLTDRFSKAIDQLGDEKLDVRLGGIYALERIARDSKRDHGPVMEVLTAYVRRYKRRDWKPEERAPYDVQAVVTVLGRRTVAHDSSDFVLDLAGADLRGLRITGDFSGAVLAGADLTGTRFFEANLEHAFLIGTKGGAAFRSTSLANAVLLRADFRRAQIAFDLETPFDGALYNDDTEWGDLDPARLGALKVN
jgi:hypothetical protein